VSLLAIVVIAGWLIVLAAGFDLVLNSRLDRQVNDALRVRAQAASATVVTSGGKVVGVRESATDSELDSSIWVYSGGRALKRPNVKPELLRAADSLARSGTQYVDHGGDRFYVLPIRVDGQRAGSVIAAIDLDPYHRTRDTAIWGSIIVTVLLIAGAYPVLRFATGRALRPVAQMTRQAAEWSISSPGQRFGAIQNYAELSSLAVTLDELLDRLAAVLRHERHLSAELSHELRTPLARVAAEVDLLIDGARPDQRAELASIRENCSSMDSIIDTLLAAARSELARTVGRCDLAPVLTAFGDEHEHPAITSTPTDLAVGVDEEIVTRILTPIVANARRYAATRIQLEARRINHAVAIDVSNDGPRLPDELAERVFEPGYRADTGDAHDGVGLGLALARRLARSADGDLIVETTAAQTTFRLLLPAG
jgi:signal transduction histidine kinase